jgi:hypothetical protein
MSNYYYLIAGLPDLSLEDNKLKFSLASAKEEIYPQLSASDREVIDLFYLQFDNANVIKLLKDKEATLDPRGLNATEKLSAAIATVKEEGANGLTALPSYMEDFVARYFHSLETNERMLMPEEELSAAYYAYGMKRSNRFVASWFEFNLMLNNILVALTARKYKIDVSSRIVGDTEVAEALRTSGARDFGLSGEVDMLEQIMKIIEGDTPVEREKKIDQLKWQWLENATFFHYFSVERIFAFLVHISLIERWLILDPETGKELFEGMINTLKENVNIPAEFK